jgi:hypothetical protein
MTRKVSVMDFVPDKDCLAPVEDCMKAREIRGRIFPPIESSTAIASIPAL